MPPPEFWLLALAMFAGTAFAVYMALRRPNAYEQELARAITLPAVEDNQYDAGDEMADYAEEIMPQQERNHPELVGRIRAKARELAAGGREITTDDIHEAMPLPPGIDGRILGAAFHPRKDWMKRGYVPSRRKENHKRPIARWMLKERVA